MELTLEKIDQAIKSLQTAKKIIKGEDKRIALKFLDTGKDNTQAAIYLLLAQLELEEEKNGK